MVYHYRKIISRLRKLPCYRIALWIFLALIFLSSPTIGILADDPPPSPEVHITITVSAYTGDLPLPPANFIITQIGTGSVNVSWTMGTGANTTIVRVSEDSCPVDYTDGYSVYNGTSNWTTYDDLIFTSTTYCFRAWSYNDVGYSLDYTEEKTGGDIMLAIAFVLLPLGLFVTALWQKKIWIMLGAGISFIALAAYGLIESGPGEALWILGIFSIVFAFIIFLYAFFGMREPAEIIPFEEADDAYERELREAREERRSKRAPWRRRPRI